MKRLTQTDHLILILVSTGLLLTAVEVRYLHRDVMRDDWIGYVPVVLSLIGAVFALVALRRSSAMRVASMGAFVIIGLSGVYGVFRHSEGKLEAFAPLFSVPAPRVEIDEDEGESEGRSSAESADTPPVLAPLGITGLSSIGLVMLLGIRRRTEA